MRNIYFYYIVFTCNNNDNVNVFLQIDSFIKTNESIWTSPKTSLLPTHSSTGLMKRNVLLT